MGEVFTSVAELIQIFRISQKHLQKATKHFSKVRYSWYSSCLPWCVCQILSDHLQARSSMRQTLPSTGRESHGCESRKSWVNSGKFGGLLCLLSGNVENGPYVMVNFNGNSDQHHYVDVRKPSFIVVYVYCLLVPQTYWKGIKVAISRNSN